MIWTIAKNVLPKENTPVLIFHTGDYPEGYDNMQVAYWENIGYEDELEPLWFTADCSFEHKEVLYWMDLPEKPKP